MTAYTALAHATLQIPNVQCWTYERTYKSKTSFQILLRQTRSATLRWRIYVVILIINTKIILLYSHIDAAPQFL